MDTVLLALRTLDLATLRAAVSEHPDAARSPRAIVEAGRLGWKSGLALLVRHGADLNATWRGYRPLHALLQEEPAFLEDLLHVGTQLPRVRIDDLELLLDAEREGGFFHVGRGQASLRGRGVDGRGAAGLRVRPVGRLTVEPLPPPARNVAQ